MTHEELLKHLTMGKRVLVKVASVEDRHRQMHGLFNAALEAGLPSIERRQKGTRIRCVNSGGLVHFAQADWEVMGLEYHAGAGPLTGVMRSRVRL